MIHYVSGQTFRKTFAGEDLSYTDFEGCVFRDCDFTRCDFTGVAFIDCVFNGCDFSSARINYVGLRGAKFIGCDFSDVNFAMVDPLLFDISFTDCRLDYAKFYTLKLARTVFSGCSIVAADFMASDLTAAVFEDCDLHQTVFLDAIANRADFSTSRNFTIDPEKTKLKQARFSRENLSGLLAKYNLVIK